jgi:predicted esterase
MSMVFLAKLTLVRFALGRMTLVLASGVTACGSAANAKRRGPAVSSAAFSGVVTVARGGEDRWFVVPDGRMKGRVYSSAGLSSHPLLMVVLHGDLAKPPPVYHYDCAQAATEGFDAVVSLPQSARPPFGDGPAIRDLVAAGLTRPGYADSWGNRSDGEMGYGAADNYTPRVVDDVAAAIRQLQAQYKPRATILVGHSGGAAIIADLLGRHPDIASAALLVACGCDPVDRRARWKPEQPDPIFSKPNPSLLPLDLAASVSTNVRVRLIVGAMDENSLPAYSEHYARVLRSHGVDAVATVLPGLKHDILFSPPVFATLEEMLAHYGS